MSPNTQPPATAAGARMGRRHGRYIPSTTDLEIVIVEEFRSCVRRAFEAAFWQHVSQSDGCWEWTGSHTGGRSRYGVFYLLSGKVLAHRASYLVNVGIIPEGFGVLHKCDNPSCVRPDHLFVGTQADNVADAMSKGRMRSPFTPGVCHPQMWSYAARQWTHCKHGHPFSEGTVNAKGFRICTECKRTASRLRMRRVRAEKRSAQEATQHAS